LPQYKDIIGWDDSAGEEAFDNAKARFWAQINGLQPEPPYPIQILLLIPLIMMPRYGTTSYTRSLVVLSLKMREIAALMIGVVMGRVKEVLLYGTHTM
jgi:hypothetical protein